MKTLEESFATVLGRPPTDHERQGFLRVREALNLKDNDALWVALMVLGHYETLYSRFPSLIAKAAAEVTVNAKAAAEAELKATAARTRSELAKPVAQTAQDIAGRVASAMRSKWFLLGMVVACGVFVGIGVSMFRVGIKVGDSVGRLDGYSKARDEKVAADWANTAEGRLARSLADAGSVHDLAACSGKGWKAKEHACVPKCERGSVDGWSIPTGHGRQENSQCRTPGAPKLLGARRPTPLLPFVAGLLGLSTVGGTPRGHQRVVQLGRPLICERSPRKTPSAE